MASSSIYSLIQSPEEQRGRRLQLRSLVDQQAMAGLQRQQAEQAMADDQIVRELTPQAGGDLAKLADLVSGRGAWRPAQAIRGQLLTQRKTETDIADTAAQTAQRRSETLGKNLSNGHAFASIVRDQAGWDAFRGYVASAIDPALAASIPAEFSPAAQQQAITTAEELRKRYAPTVQPFNTGKATVFVDTNPGSNPAITSTQLPMSTTPGQDQVDVRARETAAQTDARIKAEGAANRSVTMRGQNMTDARSREQIAATAGNASPNDSQGKAIAFASRMEDADRTFAELAKKGTDKPGQIRQAVGTLPLVGGAASAAVNMLPGALGGPSAPQQQVEQAQRNFINAVLRRESGAVISDSEFANARQQYFPQVGDSPDVIAQKARNRRISIDGMRTEAGRFGGEVDRITNKNAPAATGGASGGWSIEPVK